MPVIGLIYGKPVVSAEGINYSLRRAGDKGTYGDGEHSSYNFRFRSTSRWLRAARRLSFAANIGQSIHRNIPSPPPNENRRERAGQPTGNAEHRAMLIMRGRAGGRAVVVAAGLEGGWTRTGSLL